MRELIAVKTIAVGFLLVACAGLSISQPMKYDRLKKNSRDHDAVMSSSAAPQFRVYKQGFDMTVWLSNHATIGRAAFPFNQGPPFGRGMEYPVGSGNEHLYAASPWIGAIVDTSRFGTYEFAELVTTGYEGWGGPLEEMFGHPDGRDSFYVTSIDTPNGHNRRNFDDDGDGKIDEDELDGMDNDGDWNPLTDDLGIDGLPDSSEVGCKGAYDPVANPDPAFDNYDPAATDSCSVPLQNKLDRAVYTQNNGLPNTGEPHVDEDYGAVSEKDAYVAYYDIYGNPSPIPGHVPLGIKIWQRSYAWKWRVKAPIIILEYNVINVGTKILDSMYFGFFADPDVGPISAAGYWAHNSSGYMSDVRMAYTQNTIDLPSTLFGAALLGTSRPLDSLRWTFSWYRGEDSPDNDRGRYYFMRSGTIKQNEYPNWSDTRFFFAFGTVSKRNDMKVLPGDTATFTFALLSGQGLSLGQNNLRDNAVNAYMLYLHHFQTAPVVNSPPLHIEKGQHSVTLDWKWRTGDPRIDPLETWNDSDSFVGSLPDTHWRRVNPPTGRTRGGRIFEGFRLYKSDSHPQSVRIWGLVKQFDVDDDLHFGIDNGLQFTWTDSNLQRGKKYYYAVTSLSIPPVQVLQGPDGSLDTLIGTSTESAVEENATKVILQFGPSKKLGDVKVVPNPYRSDVDYTDDRGFEGSRKFWTESARVVWFIDLPKRATIRIFTIMGEVITSIEHNDEYRSIVGLPVGQEEFKLFSESGKPLASGVYVYLVESDLGTQTGKFVVIK